MELNERAKTCNIGKRQAKTMRKQMNAMTKSPMRVLVDLTMPQVLSSSTWNDSTLRLANVCQSRNRGTKKPYQMPRSPYLLARALAAKRKITQTTD